MFELRKVSKSFETIKVVNDFSLLAEAGEVIALLGPSGAGKSTVLQCANLLTIPEEGDIFLVGEQIEFTQTKKQRRLKSNKQLLHLRQQISMVFQQFNLWQHRTVLDNISLAPIQVLKQDEKTAHKIAKDLLAKMDLLDRADTHPKFLSGGQQQRVAIARALAMDPKVILFDEPTASLDPESGQGILQIIQDLASDGKTMLIATHEMEFAKNVADKIIFMEKGEIVAQGSTDEMFNQGISKRFKEFIGDQS